MIRLGEGTNHNAEARNNLPTPRATPVNGITVSKNRMSSLPVEPSNNPWEKPGDTNKSLPPPPSSGTTSPTERSISPPQAYNPFAQPAQQIAQSQQPSIDQAFSNMSLNAQPTGQPTQQLFPNTTGGYGNQNAAYNPFMQQTAAPPVPQIPQQYAQFTPPTSTNLTQQQFTPQAPQPSYTDPTPNPFLRTSRSQNFNPSNPFDTQGPFNAYSTANTASPFGLQPQHTAAPPQHSSSVFGLQPQPTGFQQISQSNSYNPFQASNPPSQSVFGSGMTASPAGTPFGQPMGQQSGNSYFGQADPTSPTHAQPASSPFGNPGATAPFGQPNGQSPFAPQPTGMNPFGQQANGQSSPFGQPNGSSPFGPAGPVQQQPGYQQPPPTMQQQYDAPQAPFAQQGFQSPSSAPPQQPTGMFQPPQPLAAQPTGMFHDKSSILSLYNMPHLAPQRPPEATLQNGGQTMVQDFATQQPAQPQRSVTMPVSSMQNAQASHTSPPNPFASLAGMTKPPSAMQNTSAYAAGFTPSGPSRESVDFAGLAMMSGRHSPDAFSGLSARMR